jgi:thiol-disulfide isomerase/thioredoxin
MRTLGLLAVLLSISLGLCGCSSTPRLRSGVSPKVRTVASIGDRPLPVVSGEPGSTVTAEADEPPRTSKPDGRISGRVVDPQGEPVPNARVRLAVGGVPKGRVVRATTDRSGAFTLSGLRPGASYTLIAESEDERGLMTGRIDTEAPDSGVKISLAPPNAGPRGASDPKRVSPVSDRAAADEEDNGPDETPGARWNQEDLPPPATEAEAIAPPPSRRRPADTSAVEGTVPMTARWRKSDQPTPAGTAPPEADPAANDPEVHGGAGVSSEGPALDDDGPNPLPPAREPGQALAPSDPPQERLARGSASPGRRPVRARAAGAESDPARVPGSVVIVPETYTPISLAGPPPTRASTRQPATDSPTFSPRSLKTPAAREPSEPASSPPRKRPTWEDLNATLAAPPARDLNPPGRDRGPSAPDRSTRLVSAETPVAGQAANRAPPGAGRDIVAYCRFDSRDRRILDFCLPDLEGKPVRFRDFDADLVLLDFWGSWCDPCLKSIPHLVELQSRLGEPRLKVVGIACEQGPAKDRVANVSKAVRSLGINYEVLMSGMDAATCPVQESLHIQAFPTLILIDRNGHVLWRDQGATPTTLARLDRFIASTSKPNRRTGIASSRQPSATRR